MKAPENRIKLLRNNHKPKLTQEMLAKEMGVTKLTISRWENEEVQIKPDKAKQLADYFNVEVAYLLGYYDYRNREEEIAELDSLMDEHIEDIFSSFLRFLAYNDIRLSNIKTSLIFNLIISMDENLSESFILNRNYKKSQNPYSLIDDFDDSTTPED